MTIGNAVERDHFVYVYDEKGHQLGTLFAGNGPDDGLKGYTSTTVNVRLGAVIYTYNSRCYKHYRHKADVPLSSTNVSCWGEQRTCSGNPTTSALDRLC